MKTASYDYIIRTVQQTNILPVTSACNTGCIFCSHRNNPSDIEAYCLPVLGLNDIENICDFLDGSSKIVIGESASRICEGEPFLRNDIMDILRLLRNKFPKTLIEITTSGILLTADIVNELRNIENIEINISLNSSSVWGRSKLFSLKDTENAVKAVIYLKECNIPFNGSIVAMPHVVGYEDIENTISYLCGNGAKTVRVFVPGFSGISDFTIDFFSIRQKLHEIADLQYNMHKVPVLVEPPVIEDLEAEVCGVVKGSPAAQEGIEKGDIILSVDGYKPLTRVDAYMSLYKKKNPRVRVKKGKNIREAVIEKNAGIPSGAVFYYDIHPDTVYNIEKAVTRNKSHNPLIITSELAYNVIKLGIEKLLDKHMDICAAANKWFGGTIMCAGLLTVEDIINGVSACTGDNKYDLIVLPPLPFDVNGRDISGHYFYEVEDILGIRTVIGE